MTTNVQELTEKIYHEGVLKANEDAAKILEKARKEADGIIQSAMKQKENLLMQADEAVKEAKEKADAEIRLAAQKVLGKLKQQITDELITLQVNAAVKSAFEDVEFIERMILLVIENWEQAGQKESELSLLLPAEEEKRLAEFFKRKLAMQLRKGMEIRLDPDMRNGFKIESKGGHYRLSFTDDDFENYFKNYLKEKTWELLFGDESEAD
ncbi:MAG TPA: hypothetical protein VKA27_06400 [Sunxiuqinia sp.]|nr:hypothetical protein [Sunxiuqinia sp.]